MVSFSDATGNVFYGGIFSIASLRLGLALWFSYLVCLGIYRIYFSPIAKFPGPKIAALTTWYQGYYDIWLRGQYIFRVEKMHKKYGPIVRINPHELHISDPEYIDDLYSGPSKKRDKFKFTGRSITLPESTVATMSHELHRKRRAAMNPYFSKTSVRRLEPIILESLGKLLARLDACFKSGEIMPMTVAYKATTSDIITHYSFGESTDYLDKEDYNVTFFEAVESLFELAHWMTHIAWVGPLMAAIPIPIAAKFLPGMDSLVKMQKQWKSQIEKIRDSKDEEFGKNTVFHGVLRSNLPESEKSSSRLQQEAQLLVLAGQDTTATTLSAITYHLLANPDKLKKLRAELEVAMPDPNSPPTCAQVEQLPYLTAVIQEGIRLHPGAIMRMQRVSPDEPLYYGKDSNAKWTIPAGTPVSMDAFSTQTNPAIFPEPREFRPERWIGNHRLDRYLLSFSKGTRGCLGINLAYQELYLVLAGVFRKYDVDDGTSKDGPRLKLYETIRERDIDAAAEMVVPVPALGSKHLRVRVL